jgi:hypothetical protein
VLGASMSSEGRLSESAGQQVQEVAGIMAHNVDRMLER